MSPSGMGELMICLHPLGSDNMCAVVGALQSHQHHMCLGTAGCAWKASRLGSCCLGCTSLSRAQIILCLRLLSHFPCSSCGKWVLMEKILLLFFQHVILVLAGWSQLCSKCAQPECCLLPGFRMSWAGILLYKQDVFKCNTESSFRSDCNSFSFPVCVPVLYNHLGEQAGACKSSPCSHVSLHG